MCWYQCWGVGAGSCIGNTAGSNACTKRNGVHDEIATQNTTNRNRQASSMRSNNKMDP